MSWQNTYNRGGYINFFLNEITSYLMCGCPKIQETYQ